MTMASTQNGQKFGTCCNDLGELLEASEFEPFIQVGDDGVLYMTVGMTVTEEEEDEEDETGGFLDHPVFFCPFCGTSLQTPEEVEEATS